MGLIPQEDWSMPGGRQQCSATTMVHPAKSPPLLLQKAPQRGPNGSRPWGRPPVLVTICFLGNGSFCSVKPPGACPQRAFLPPEGLERPACPPPLSLWSLPYLLQLLIYHHPYIQCCK